ATSRPVHSRISSRIDTAWAWSPSGESPAAPPARIRRGSRCRGPARGANAEIASKTNQADRETSEPTMTTSAPPPLRPAARVPPERFQLPIERLRQGYYSDKYFVRARDVLIRGAHDRPRTMQVFQKQAACLGGVDEAIAFLKLCLTDGYGWRDLEVLALRDGDFVEPGETVMLVTGPYAAFAHLETVYLGVLARRTRVATNTRRVVEAAWPKPVMFFPARFDHWLVQTGDGYAAHIAGAIGVSTDAQASWWGAEGLGTVPHALIAAFGGDTVAATRAFADVIPA